MIPFPDKKYAIIYADPPWEQRACNWVPGKHGKEYSNALPYNTMSIDEIKSVPVSLHVENDALLFIWVVERHIPNMIEIMCEWGFRYHSLAFVWHKTSNRLITEWPAAPGQNHTQRSCEFCFMGQRGKWIGQSNVMQFLNAPRREHSRKPDEVRLRIDSLVGDVPKIELFARKRFAGWDAWGNEVMSV